LLYVQQRKLYANFQLYTTILIYASRDQAGLVGSSVLIGSGLVLRHLPGLYRRVAWLELSAFAGHGSGGAAQSELR